MKTLNLSSRAKLLKPSPTLAMTTKANALRSQGVDVISLAAGEPDFNTPEPICNTTIAAIEAGFTKYTSSSGIPELKEAIVQKLSRENGFKPQTNQVVVSCGAKHSLYNTFQTVLDPGDEVILIAPYWMTYADQIVLAGGVPVVIPTEGSCGFVPEIHAIKKAITLRTRAIVINSPSNPAGALLNRQILKEIAALALRHDLWIVSDEIYERLVYGDTFTSIASLSQEVAEHTITIGGCSKTYAMTGWRLGFSISPAPIAQAMANLQDQVTSNPTSFVQKGAVTAFQLPSETIEAMRAEFEARRDLIVSLVREIPDVQLESPKGAFYVFPDISAYLHGKITNDLDLADYLLQEAHVACVPGSVFEGAGRIRLSYAASRENIKKGIERISSALQSIR